MARPRKLATEIPPGLTQASQGARELGMASHPLSILITEYDYHRLKVMSELGKGGGNASEIIRKLIGEALDSFTAEKGDMLDREAVISLEFEADRIARRAAYDGPQV